MNNLEGRGRSPDLPPRKRKDFEGYHFITLVTNNRIEVFKYKYLAELAAKTLVFYSKRGDYDLLGYVIMPEHIHFICNILGEKIPFYSGGSDVSGRRIPQRSDSLPRGEASFLTSRTISEIVRDIKKYISREVVKYLSEWDRSLLSKFKMSKPLKKRHIYQIWQSDFYDFNIISERKLEEKLRYMYENPTRKGICNDIFDYEYSDIWQYFGSVDSKLP